MSTELIELLQKADVRLISAFVSPSLSSYQQIELLKVLINGRWIEFGKHFSKGFYMGEINFKHRISTPDFESTLCGLICQCWETFNDEDKERIRSILKGEK